jgi:hypothetical protein
MVAHLMRTPGQLNLVLGWLWILLGFVSGALLGLRFHDERWLGGYASWRRRLYRLAHISFFGLGLLNLMFFLTVRGATSVSFQIASLAFAIGALTMPLCCVLAAHKPDFKPVFALPVLSLSAGALLTVWILASL